MSQKWVQQLLVTRSYTQTVFALIKVYIYWLKASFTAVFSLDFKIEILFNRFS